MNLFQNMTLVQAIRDAFDLSIPQAQVVLIAYQHGSVCGQSVRKLFGYNTHRLSGSAALSKPTRKKLIVPIGKVRSKTTHKVSTAYKIRDMKAIERVIEKASDENIEIFKWLSLEELHAQNEIYEAPHENQ